MGDLTSFEALAGGAFDHLNCQDTGEFHQNFSRKSNAWGVQGGGGIERYKSYSCLLLNEER